MRARWGALVAALAAVGSSSVAMAQQIMPGPGPGSFGAGPPEGGAPETQGVLQRPRPDYDPLGVPLGSFIVFPSAVLTENYDSNVFAIPSPGVKGDFFTDLAPSVAVDSNWNNNALNLLAGGDIKRYDTLVSENVSNANFSTGGRIDILRDVYLSGGMGYQLEHEDRASPNSITGQKNPTEYQVAGGGLSYVQQPGRLGFRIDGVANYFSYDNAQTATGTTIIETDRNRLEATIKPRLIYEVAQGYNAFVQLQANRRDYQSQFDQFGEARTSHGYEADAGTALDLGGLITGEIYAGYLDQYYSTDHVPTAENVVAPPLNKPSVSGVGFGMNLLWNVTEIDSVRFTASRTVQETIVNNTVGTAVLDASADLVSLASVSVEHELRSNVILTAGVIYSHDDFEGIGKSADNYEADAGGRYLINRNLSAGLDFSYRNRSSNITGFDYSRELVMAKLRTQF